MRTPESYEAEIKVLREALEYAVRQVCELGTVPGIAKVLATPPGDMAALREVIAQVIVEAKDNYVNVRNAADDLRSGEWTPEVFR